MAWLTTRWATLTARDPSGPWTWLRTRWQRVLAVALGLAGLALAVPAVVGPTWQIALSDGGRGLVLVRESRWSWGKFVTVNSDAVLREVTNRPGLLIYVALLVIGLIGLVACVVVPGPHGTLACAVALAAVATRLVTAVVERIGLSAQEDYYAPTGLDVRTYTQPAAAFETASAVLLVAALVLVLVVGARDVMALGHRSGADVATGGADAAGPDTGAGLASALRADHSFELPPDVASPVPRVGVARLEPDDRPEHLAGEEVSFTDAPPAPDGRSEHPG